MSARNVGRSYNTMVYRSVKQWSESRTPADVLAEFETYAGSTRHVAVTTTVEPLLDVQVHSQDILRPLGLRHDMPPDAGAADDLHRPGAECGPGRGGRPGAAGKSLTPAATGAR